MMPSNGDVSKVGKSNSEHNHIREIYRTLNKYVPEGMAGNFEFVREYFPSRRDGQCHSSILRFKHRAFDKSIFIDRGGQFYKREKSGEFIRIDGEPVLEAFRMYKGEAVREVRRPRFVIEASRKGFCPFCQAQIVVGEKIAKGDLGWGHEDCVSKILSGIPISANAR